jgi:hypothetical protein
VGIDDYPAPFTLQGCVNDANTWGELLTGFGYQVSYLRNAEATHARITERLRQLVEAAEPGDHLVFQYAGHGTQVTDFDGDERSGMDQAYVPMDYGTGVFLIDDDVRTILLQLPEDVEMTVFIDCCHSATSTRIFGRTPPPPPPDSRRRLLIPTPEQLLAHKEYRKATGARALRRELVDRSVLRWVNFSACQTYESAFETGGSGDFTRLATRLLRQGLAGVTNREFQRRLVAEFGDGRRQSPYLDCTIEAEDAPLLAGIARAGPGVQPPPDASGVRAGAPFRPYRAS